MTQVWQGEKVVAVTKVQAGPCPVVQLKDLSQDGYNAVQLGFGERKEKNIKKPQLGHLKKAGIAAKYGKTSAKGGSSSGRNLKYYREFRAEAKDLKIGDMVDVSTFQVGDVIKATGTSKGKGFQGSVKRHHFHGHNTTHGTKDQVRTSGSIGAGGPQHVFKGRRMPGRMGDERVTVSNLKIVEVDKVNDILYVSGAVPGARNSLLLIYGDGELKVAQPVAPEIKPAAAVETVAEKKAETAAEPTKAADKKEIAVKEKITEAKIKDKK